MNLPPLDKVDNDLHLGHSEKTELSFPNCKHEPEIVSSTEAKCRKCPAGWSGPNIQRLIDAFKTS